MGSQQTPEEFLLAAIAATARLEPATLTASARLTDLGIDSLNLTTIIADVEAIYRRTFTPQQLLQLFAAETVADVVTLVAN